MGHPPSGVYFGGGRIFERAPQTQITLRAGGVAQDLLLQRLGRWPLPFVADSLAKDKLERRLLREIDGMKVQEVRLHREGVGSEGRPMANIRHRVEPLVAGAQP